MHQSRWVSFELGGCETLLRVLVLIQGNTTETSLPSNDISKLLTAFCVLIRAESA